MIIILIIIIIINNNKTCKLYEFVDAQLESSHVSVGAMKSKLLSTAKSLTIRALFLINVVLRRQKSIGFS